MYNNDGVVAINSKVVGLAPGIMDKFILTTVDNYGNDGPYCCIYWH
jgi:hypothetical protein